VQSCPTSNSRERTQRFPAHWGVRERETRIKSREGEKNECSVLPTDSGGKNRGWGRLLLFVDAYRFRSLLELAEKRGGGIRPTENAQMPGSSQMTTATEVQTAIRTILIAKRDTGSAKERQDDRVPILNPRCE